MPWKGTSNYPNWAVKQQPMKYGISPCLSALSRSAMVFAKPALESCAGQHPRSVAEVE